MELDLSIIVAAHNSERFLAPLVRALAELGRGLELPENDTAEPAFEILAMDQGSRDNSLAVLSVLQSHVPQLQSFQDVAPGTAILRGARLARGRAWLIVDRDADLELAGWAAHQVLRGHRAAIVPGEVLAVEGRFGQGTLGWTRGGLITAQREVRRALSRRGDRPAFSPSRRRGVSERAQRLLRARIGRLGLLAAFDRPW